MLNVKDFARKQLEMKLPTPKVKLFGTVKDRFGRVKTKEGKSINPDGSISEPTIPPPGWQESEKTQT